MLFERLSEDEKVLIELLRHNYTDAESTDFFEGEFVDTKTFLRFWEAEKAHMADAFNGNLIVKKPLNISLEGDELHDKMCSVFWSNECPTVREHIISTFEEANRNVWTDGCLINGADRHCSLSEIFNHTLFQVDNWISNVYDGPTCEIKAPNGDTVKLVHGCKLMKLLGRLAKLCGPAIADAFENLRLKQSQVMNEAKITANLCISIHPLDFMTASLNDNDWRSCMCWDDGEYRRGVIEMMNSPMVVVAYIESKNQQLNWYNNLSWNSKRWREFFIVRNDIISGIKGYPYWNRNLEDAALNMLRDMFAPVFKQEYAPKIYTWAFGSPIVDNEFDIDYAPNMSCGPAMYNDFYSDNEYHSILAVHAVGELEKSLYYRGPICHVTDINYSGISECVCCGEESDFDSENDIVCVDCCKHYYCSHCGDIIQSRYDLYEVAGSYYCQYCFNELEHCDRCDAVIDVCNDESTIRFVVGWEDKTPDLYHQWHNYIPNTEVMRSCPPGDETYEEQEIIVRNVCASCARYIFVDGTAEIYNPHYFCLSGSSVFDTNYAVIPLSHFTEAGLKELFYSRDIEYFKSYHTNAAECSA